MTINTSIENDNKPKDSKSDQERVVMLPCPTSKGHWKKVFEGEESFFDVYFRQHRMALNVAFATNENQTDPCEALSGEWVKISNEYQGRLRT